MQRQWLGRTLAGVACAALLAAGCSGDDDDATPSSGNPPTTSATTEAAAADPAAAYCTAEAAMETAPAPDTSAAASDEEAATIVQSWANETVQPLVGPIVEAAPDEIAGDIGLMADAVEQLGATGDTSVLQTPEFEAASDNVHAYDVANCGWTSVEVTATDYQYGGIPGEIAAGVTNFEIANQGAEPHELRIYRKADGVTATPAELLALPEDQQQGQFEMVGTGEYVDPADDGYFVTELTPGEYFAACSIPVGATPEAPPADPNAPSHFAQGMLTEFTVG